MQVNFLGVVRKPRRSDSMGKNYYARKMRRRECEKKKGISKNKGGKRKN